MTSTVVILLGAPGAGKGTQAARLSSALGMPHISTGDLFRENIGQGTEIGVQAKAYLESGKLVPDALVLDMLFERVGRSDCSEGYLLDGFPRTVPQAEALAERLQTDDGEPLVPTVVDIQVPDADIERRIVGRRTCSKCGTIYHLEFSPPARDGACGACGSELVQRKDDTSEVVKKRLGEYHSYTAPVVAYYKARGSVCEVDGRQAQDAVFRDCIACIQVGDHA